MKKKEYLSFHAKVLFAISQKVNNPLIWSFSEQSQVNEFGQSGSYYDSSKKEMKSESDLLKALESGAKPSAYNLYKFTDLYLEEVLVNGTNEQIEFFVKQNNSLIGEFSLADINKVIPKLNEEKVNIILSKGSNTFGIFHSPEFENTIKIIKDYSKATEVLSAYIEIKSKAIIHEYMWISIRSKLIEYFPNKLKDFSNLNIIKEYLASLEDKPDPFIKTDITRTIYLRLNCETLQKAYPLTFGTFKFYNGSIKKLIKAFEKNLHETGVVKTHVNDSIPSDTGYQYTHIYINLAEQSRLKEGDIKEIIAEYYGDYLPTFDNKTFHKIDIMTENWVRAKLLYNDLNKEVKVNGSSDTKLVKI